MGGKRKLRDKKPLFRRDCISAYSWEHPFLKTLILRNVKECLFDSRGFLSTLPVIDIKPNGFHDSSRKCFMLFLMLLCEIKGEDGDELSVGVKSVDSSG